MPNQQRQAYRRQSSQENQRTVEIDGHSVSYLVRRHPKAKHMRLRITPFDGVVVTLPLRLPRYINPDRFVQDNGPWVLEKLREAGHHVSPSGSESQLRGRRILFRGKPYRIVVERLIVSRPRVRLNEQRETISIYLPRNPEITPEGVLKAWLREEAAKQIRKTVIEEARAIGVKCKRVTVREQKTKWGSCTSDGNISFNWRLILFPPRVLRYVVIHELCHLRHFDHSIRFWRLVQKHMADYHTSVEWLRTEGMNAQNLLVGL